MKFPILSLVGLYEFISLYFKIFDEIVFIIGVINA